MKNNTKLTVYQITAGLIMSVLSFSTQSHILGDFELSAAIGGSWYQADNATTQVTLDERDANNVSSATNSALFSAGLGRHVFQDALKTRTFITGLLWQVNYYYGESTVKGHVWGYESPNVNNYTFRAPLKSSRLMIDLKPEIFVYHGYTPYAIMGAGASWNDMSYSESPVNSDVDPLSAVVLQNHTNVTVAYNLGLGLSKHITANTYLSMEYFYTSLGRISPSINSISQQPIVGAPSFAVTSQNLLLRLNWKIDDLKKIKML